MDYDWEGTPAKLDDGEWGALIWSEAGDGEPVEGDQVLVKTRTGLRLRAQIEEVQDVALRRGGRIFICALENQNWL